MTAPRPIDFVRAPASPALDPGFEGVIIAAEATSEHGELRRLVLRGAYQITVGEARLVGVVPLHRALVVTATSGLLFEVFSLVGPTLTFEDDETVGGGVVRGWFNAELAARLPIAPYRTGHLLVSLGARVSNVVRITAS